MLPFARRCDITVNGRGQRHNRCPSVRPTSHSTFGDMSSPHTRPALLIARNTVPCVMAAAAVHASTVLFTHVGIGTVRTCPPLPTRSAITQWSSRCLDRLEVQRQQLGAAEPAANQQATIAW